MQIILDLRGSNTATVRDMVDMRKFVKEQMKDLGKKIDMRLSACYQGYQRASSSTPMLSGTESPPSSSNTRAHFHGLVESALNALLSAHEQEISALHSDNFRLQDVLQNLNTATIPQMLPLAANPIKSETRTEGAMHARVHGSVTSSVHGCCQENVRQSGKLQEIKECEQEFFDVGDHVWLTPGPAQICDALKRPECSLTLGDAGHARESSPEQQLPTNMLRDAAGGASAHHRFMHCDPCWGVAHNHDCHHSPELRPTASYVL